MVRATDYANNYLVLSSNKNKWYQVYVPDEPSYGESTCTCPDFIHRKHICKHIKEAFPV